MLATLSVAVLLIFSSVATVVFKLVTCAAITIDSTTDYVVFIDGSVKCYDGNRNGQMAIVVFLCLFPFLFAAALRRGWLSESVQVAVCGAFKMKELLLVLGNLLYISSVSSNMSLRMMGKQSRRHGACK
jgi:hypothetical protein